MTAANFEKLYSKDKVRLGRQLLTEISPKKLKSQHLWALSRLAARELLYGPADRTIPPAEAARWIEQLIGYTWSKPTMPAGPFHRSPAKQATGRGISTKKCEIGWWTGWRSMD